MKLRLCRGLSRYSGNALYTNPAALYEGIYQEGVLESAEARRPRSLARFSGQGVLVGRARLSTLNMHHFPRDAGRGWPR
jgi:hypothetical protein